MCTAMTVRTPGGAVFFGRTMDFSYEVDPELYLVPRGYAWNNLQNTHQIKTLYSFLGVGQDVSPLLFADGVNERGFAAAALYFPGFAQYDAPSPRGADAPAIAATEVVKLLLGVCGSVEEAAAVLPTLRIVGARDAVTGSAAPLHWLLADESGACMTVEKTAEGLALLENPVGVLTNSPDFRWHLANLRNYMAASPVQREAADWSGLSMTPFGQGAGLFGLPGDYSPPARFVRTAFQKSHAVFPEDREQALSACFHVLEGVSIPKGVVVTDRGTWDYTQYTSFMDLGARAYCFRTYDDSRTVSARLPGRDLRGPGLLSLGKLLRREAP